MHGFRTASETSGERLKIGAVYNSSVTILEKLKKEAKRLPQSATYEIGHMKVTTNNSHYRKIKFPLLIIQFLAGYS